MVKTQCPRRGRCPHRPERFENRAVRLYETVPPIRSRGDVGIAPYAVGESSPFSRASLLFLRVPSTPNPAAALSPSRRGLFQSLQKSLRLAQGFVSAQYPPSISPGCGAGLPADWTGSGTTGKETAGSFAPL